METDRRLSRMRSMCHLTGLRRSSIHTVSFRGRSGIVLLNLRLTGFDPRRTSAVALKDRPSHRDGGAFANMMNLLISLPVFALIFGGALAGMAVRRLLSEHHLHSRTLQSRVRHVCDGQGSPQSHKAAGSQLNLQRRLRRGVVEKRSSSPYRRSESVRC